jgi:hypothetical protein
MVVTVPELPPREERMGHLLPASRRLLAEAAELNLGLRDVIELLQRAADGGSQSASKPNNPGKH